jgi:tetrapyrrole methylase family protein/MazG family protein
VRPVVRVVGLGPGAPGDVTRRAFELLNLGSPKRLRTRQHPSAQRFDHLESYDSFYEDAESFEALYEAIVVDLVRLANESPTREVVYAVPGSPVVAERTVELLLMHEDIETILEPAVSVIDVVCARLGRDPMAAGLRILDALSGTQDFRGPGPLLILQTYSPEVLASVADRLPADIEVTVVHHAGLEDEVIVTVLSSELTSFTTADHLTSIWVEGLRDAGEAANDLVELMRRLRAECPWDQEQTHASLTRHLLEEAYEALDALETFVRVESDGRDNEHALRHVEEELGDLLFQIIFHAELGDEENNFNFASIADAVRDKLVNRHPHVFGDVVVASSNEVASRWEDLKRKEKGRESITDGIAWQLPAITLYTKLLRKAVLVDIGVESGRDAQERAVHAISSLQLADASAHDARSSSHVDHAWGEALASLVTAAYYAGVDLEGVLRERAMLLRDVIRESEIIS